MEKWKYDLVIAIENNFESVGEKKYLRCPYCDSITFEKRVFSEDNCDYTTVLRPSVMLGRFVYFPTYKAYGEICRCTNCDTKYYCYIQENKEELHTVKDEDISDIEIYVEHAKHNGDTVFMSKKLQERMK